jgi:hypothetical protein
VELHPLAGGGIDPPVIHSRAHHLDLARAGGPGACQ